MSNHTDVNGTIKLKEVKHMLKCLNEQPHNIYLLNDSKKCWVFVVWGVLEKEFFFSFAAEEGKIIFGISFFLASLAYSSLRKFALLLVCIFLIFFSFFLKKNPFQSFLITWITLIFCPFYCTHFYYHLSSSASMFFWNTLTS